MSETLLHQIQMEAVDADHDLASLLRKCRILAQRLNNQDLKAWVINELDGYATKERLPDYRMLERPIMLGHYVGAFGYEVRNVQIPVSAVSEKYRQTVFCVQFCQGVTELQAQIASSDDNGFIRIAVPPEAHAVIKYRNVR